MGVLNLTPDSFSDGGRLATTPALIDAAANMVAAGASILDVGGESTRPGARPVGSDEEITRVIPAIEAIASRFDCPLSIDTRKPEVMTAAVAAGASLINDVGALQAPGALDTAAGLGVPVVLMHMLGEPATMQDAPVYADPVTEVADFLAARVAACLAAGLPRDRIMIDPGFGFGKKLPHNLALLRGLNRLRETLGLPVMAGLSRKSMIGELTGCAVEDRLHGSVALAVYAALRGASIVRVHDVGPTVTALRAIAPLQGEFLNG